MLKVLLKKQIAEVFRNFFYDAKKNRMRSKAAVAGWIVFYVLLMVVILGGMFTALSLAMCEGLTGAGMGWLYFLIMSGIAIVLGAFGSVFSTYSGLYLSKDNDLLLSMPIPVRTIITARLTNVYLMGAMYSAVVLLPALIVYWAVAGLTVSRLICGILLIVIITVIVLILSCLLGWVVAKISVKLKNRSFVTVVIAIVFIVLYYVVYFKAGNLIQDIIMNAAVYGEKIKGAAYVLYLFGLIGVGDWPATGIWLAVTAVLFGLMWLILARTFLNIATASGATEKVRYKEKSVKRKGAFRALLGKELARFTSSANYMLNCGLGVLLLVACAVLIVIKGGEVFAIAEAVFANRPGLTAVLLCTVFCMLASMNDMAAPSVSLEGKNLWIVQSMPVLPKTALRAKLSLELLLTGIPMLLAVICAAAVIRASLPVRLMLCVTPLICTVFFSAASTAIGVRMPLLNWTNELAPIKQSGAVTIALLGGWGLCIVFGGLYFLVAYKLGAALYMLIWSAVLAAASILLMRWIDTKGAAAYAAL